MSKFVHAKKNALFDVSISYLIISTVGLLVLAVEPLYLRMREKVLFNEYLQISVYRETFSRKDCHILGIKKTQTDSDFGPLYKAALPYRMKNGANSQ